MAESKKALQQVKMQSIPQQGEIWLVEFPKTKESRKPIRPCLIISNNLQNKHDEQIIVTAITTQEVIPGETQFFEIPIVANRETGLDENSRILLNRIHTVDKKLRLLKKLGKIKLEAWENVLKSFWLVLTSKQI